MASLSVASVSVPSFCGLRLSESTTSKPAAAALPLTPTRSSASSSASLSDLTPSKTVAAPAAIALTASLLLASSSPALAAKIEVGDEVGSFKFSPSSLTVAAGESIVFTLVGETGHNVVFDIPPGAPPPVAKELEAASMGENDLLTEDDNTFTVKLSTPGTYTFYCTPHKSSNMTGKVTVK